MAERIVKVALIGDASKLKGALKEAETSSGQLGNAHDFMANKMKLALAGAGIAAVAFAKKSVDAYVTAGTETLKLQRLTGGTAEQMSALRGAAELTGTDIDALGKGMVKLSKAIGASNDTTKDFGFASRDANGNLLPLNETLGNVADRFKGMEAGVDKNRLAVQLFGKAGTELLPFLNRGKDGIAALEEKARSLGIVMSGKDLEAVKKYKMEQRELGVAVEGLSMKLGSILVPALTKVTGAAVGALSKFEKIVDPSKDSEVQAAKQKTLSMSYDELGASIDRTHEIAATYHKEAADSWNPIDGFSAAVAAKAADAIENESKAMRGMADAATIAYNEQAKHNGVQEANHDQLLKFIEDQAKLGITYTDATQAAADYTSSVKDSTWAGKQNAAAIAEQDDELKKLTDSLKAQFDPLFGFIDAQKKLNDANWAAAVALKEHGRGSNEYKQAAEEAGKAALDFKVAQDELKEAVNTGKVSLEDGTKTVEDWVAQGIITRDTANEMEQSFRKAGYASQIEGHATMDMSQAVQAIADFYKWTHANQIDVPMQLIKAPDQHIGHMAAGGFMGEGWTIVGENGPEPVRKDGSNVRVFSNPEGRVMSGMSSNDGWGSGDIVLKLGESEFARWVHKTAGAHA